MLKFRKLPETHDVSPVIEQINNFISSRWYIVAIMMLSIAGNVLSIELFVYGVFTLLVFYACIFGRDLLPLMPIFIFAYLIPSSKNNPGKKEITIFSMEHGGILIIGCAIIIAASFLYRIIRDRRKFFGRKYRLMPGILLLSAAYLLGGIGSEVTTTTQLKSTFFGLLQSLSILVPYFLFSGGIDWKKAQKDYFAWVGVAAGCLLLAEILWLYLSANVITDGVIKRSLIFTGWGICNNIGGMLALMIPFAFYLTLRSHYRNWFGAMMASAFLLGAYFTCSRNAIFTGTGIYILSFVAMLHYSDNRKHSVTAVILFVSCMFTVFLIRSDKILQLFSIVVEKGFTPSARDTIFSEGLKLFSKAPVFGTSFYSPGYVPFDASKVESFSAIFPARWHNTVIQLLACCGIFGIGTYLFHRVQTVRLLLTERSPEKIFIACSVLVLLVSSLLDCHFFNIGPTLFYSMALAFGENCAHCEE